MIDGHFLRFVRILNGHDQSNNAQGYFVQIQAIRDSIPAEAPYPRNSRGENALKESALCVTDTQIV